MPGEPKATGPVGRSRRPARDERNHGHRGGPSKAKERHLELSPVARVTGRVRLADTLQRKHLPQLLVALLDSREGCPRVLLRGVLELDHCVAIAQKAPDGADSGEHERRNGDAKSPLWSPHASQRDEIGFEEALLLLENTDLFAEPVEAASVHRTMDPRPTDALGSVEVGTSARAGVSEA
jgi:hypothetical protein